MGLVVLSLLSCSKTEVPAKKTFADVAESYRPDDLWDYSYQNRYEQLDTNIADYYEGFAEYFPYVEYSTPQDPINIGNLVHGGNPYGDLRVAFDTTNGNIYGAYWFDTTYQGLELSVIIYTLRTDYSQNWVYVINNTDNTIVQIQGETFTQDFSTTPYNQYGSLRLFGVPNVPNIGSWDVNPFKDTQNRLYTAARWDHEIILTHNSGAILKGRCYSYIRNGEGLSQSLFQGQGVLNSFPTSLTPLSTPLYDSPLYTIEYQGQEVEVAVYPESMNSFVIGQNFYDVIPGVAQGQTGLCRTYVQGIGPNGLINIPMSEFTRIKHRSNRGAATTFNAL